MYRFITFLSFIFYCHIGYGFSMMDLDTLRTYDKKGNILTSQYPNEEGIGYANQVIHFEYDRKGRLCKEFSKDTLGKMIVVPKRPSITTYKYKKKKGNKVVITEFFDENMKPAYFSSAGFQNCKTTYNKNGIKLEDWCFTMAGFHQSRSQYFYDKNDKLTEVRYLDDKGSLLKDGYAVVKMEYDAEGRETKRYFFDSERKPFESLNEAHLVVTEYRGEENESCTRYYNHEEEPMFLKSQLLSKPKQALDLEYPGTDRETLHKLSDLKGKVVILSFWGPWCRPCRAHNPELVSLYDKYKDDGLEIFSVALETDEKRWKEAIKEDNLYWNNHVSDMLKWNSKPAKEYGVKGVPQMFVLDREGNVVSDNARGFCALEEVLLQLL